MYMIHLTPPKTNMEPENGGPLESEIPSLETIISRFQPLIFGGVTIINSPHVLFVSHHRKTPRRRTGRLALPPCCRALPFGDPRAPHRAAKLRGHRPHGALEETLGWGKVGLQTPFMYFWIYNMYHLYVFCYYTIFI